MFQAVGAGLVIALLSNKIICEIVFSTGVILQMLKVNIGYKIAATSVIVFTIATMVKAMI